MKAGYKVRMRATEIKTAGLLPIVPVIVAMAAGQALPQSQTPRNAPAATPAPAGAGRGAGFRTAFDPRPPADPIQVERGKALYGVRCTFCHGADARGGGGGPNLVRSVLIVNDITG